MTAEASSDRFVEDQSPLFGTGLLCDCKLGSKRPVLDEQPWNELRISLLHGLPTDPSHGYTCAEDQKNARFSAVLHDGTEEVTVIVRKPWRPGMTCGRSRGTDGDRRPRHGSGGGHAGTDS